MGKRGAHYINAPPYCERDQYSLTFALRLAEPNNRPLPFGSDRFPPRDKLLLAALYIHAEKLRPRDHQKSRISKKSLSEHFASKTVLCELNRPQADETKIAQRFKGWLDPFDKHEKRVQPRSRGLRVGFLDQRFSAGSAIAVLDSALQRA